MNKFTLENNQSLEITTSQFTIRINKTYDGKVSYVTMIPRIDLALHYPEKSDYRLVVEVVDNE